MRGVAPVVVGAIGHRTLSADHVDRIRIDCAHVLERHRIALPSTDVVLLTSLAEGADALAAEAAVGLNIPVVALLPMNRAEYARDFESAAAIEQHEHLLLEASVIDGPSLGSTTREAAYQRCARELAATCGTLVAVWDGTAPDLPAGTADTVYFTLPGVSGLPDLSHGPATLATEHPLVLCIDSAAAAPVTRIESVDSATQWDGVPDHASVRIDEFNREAADSEIHTEGSVVGRLFTAADALAVRMQSRHRRWTIILLALGVFAVASVDTQQQIEQRWFFGIQVLGILLMLTLWWLLSRWRIKDRFQEYRALAEGARVQMVWRDAGIDDSVSNYYLAGSGVEGVWIRRALRGSRLVERSMTSLGSDATDARAWMEDQVTYFEGSHGRGGAIAKSHRKARRCSTLAIVAVATSLVGFIPDVMQLVLGVDLDARFVSWCFVLRGVGVACAAAFVAYSELMGFEQVSRRYQLSAAHFRQALVDFDRADTNEGRLSVVRVMGIEALREAGDWLALHATRGVRPV